MANQPTDYWTAATAYTTRYQRESQRQRKAQPEHAEQCAFFERVRWARKRYPGELGYQLTFAVPNGAFLPRRQDRNGEWYSPEGQKLRDSGMEAGIPDVLCLVARGRYGGLAIELKQPRKYLSREQREKRELIEAAGWAYAVCRSAEAAWEALQRYLRSGEP